MNGHGLLDLFLLADPIVKAVMLLLVLASVGCWAVAIDKSMTVRNLRRQAAALEAFAKATQAGTAKEPGGDGTAAIVARAGLREWRERADPELHESRSERRERIERAMRAALSAELRRAEGALPMLATIGSAGPFVGLFGTVWGIMNSFTAIAQSNDTSLAVVAPGIAEALFATALGLVAAIPAVIAYNRLAVSFGRVGQRMGAALGELGNQLARRPAAPLARAAE